MTTDALPGGHTKGKGEGTVEIVWIAVCSGLFELAMIVVIVLANNALQAEENHQRLLEQLERN